MSQIKTYYDFGTGKPVVDFGGGSVEEFFHDVSKILTGEVNKDNCLLLCKLSDMMGLNIGESLRTKANCLEEISSIDSHHNKLNIKDVMKGE